MPLICERLPNSISEVIGSKVLYLHESHPHTKMTKGHFPLTGLCHNLPPPCFSFSNSAPSAGATAPIACSPWCSPTLPLGEAKVRAWICTFTASQSESTGKLLSTIQKDDRMTSFFFLFVLHFICLWRASESSINLGCFFFGHRRVNKYVPFYSKVVISFDVCQHYLWLSIDTGSLCLLRGWNFIFQH